MTAIILTVTPERAVMTTDRRIDTNQSVPGYPEGVIQKVDALPERSMLVAVAGSLVRSQAWSKLLREEVPAGDIDGIRDHVPEYLNQVLQIAPAPNHPELIVIHAGYSQRQGRVVGYAYQSANGFVPTPLNAGHTMMPQVDPEAPGYRELAEHWPRAVQGAHVEGFHDRVLANQIWQGKQGRLWNGLTLSRDYDRGTVGPWGAQVSEPMNWPVTDSATIGQTFPGACI